MVQRDGVAVFTEIARVTHLCGLRFFVATSTNSRVCGYASQVMQCYITSDAMSPGHVQPLASHRSLAV